MQKEELVLYEMPIFVQYIPKLLHEFFARRFAKKVDKKWARYVNRIKNLKKYGKIK